MGGAVEQSEKLDARAAVGQSNVACVLVVAVDDTVRAGQRDVRREHAPSLPLPWLDVKSGGW